MTILITILIILAVIILLISLNALYVAGEFATVAARKTRIYQMAEAGNSTAKSLLNIMEDSHLLDQFIATSQIGITISSLLLGIFGERIISPQLPFENAALSSTIVLAITTVTQVVFGELVPKSLAVQFPETIALFLYYPMRFSMWLLSGLLFILNGSASVILKWLGMEGHGEHGHVHSPQEIEILVEESFEGGLLDAEEKQMLRNAFRMRDLTARQVMIPRRRIVAAPVSDSVQDVMQLSVETGKSRIPLFEGDIDKIAGFVHVRDLYRLHVKGETHLPEKLRPVVHIPEAMSVSEVWDKLDQAGQYFGIVFDEFGGTYGLITLEDIIEEIFGELQDESDHESALIYKGAQGRLRFRWDWLIADINEYFELELIEEWDTLDALVISELGRDAEEGDEVVVNGTTIRVEKKGEHGIEELSLVNPEKPKLADETIYQIFTQNKSSVAGKKEAKDE
ncbi:MAG: hemolysin family protein [Chloroflexota bacterium]